MIDVSAYLAFEIKWALSILAHGVFSGGIIIVIVTRSLRQQHEIFIEAM